MRTVRLGRKNILPRRIKSVYGYLNGTWQGDFATFGPGYQARVTLELQGKQAKVQLTHSEDGWPEDDGVTTESSLSETDGILTVRYPSKEKDCSVELKLVHVGDTLRGTLKFITASGVEWV